jgi:hypothetical protein
MHERNKKMIIEDKMKRKKISSSIGKKEIDGPIGFSGVPS